MVFDRHAGDPLQPLQGERRAINPGLMYTRGTHLACTIEHNVRNGELRLGARGGVSVFRLGFCPCCVSSLTTRQTSKAMDAAAGGRRPA